MTKESVQMSFILPQRSISRVCKVAHGHLFQFTKNNPLFCTFNLSYINIEKRFVLHFTILSERKRCPIQMKLKQFSTDLMLLFKATTSSQREALETDISKMVVV